MGAGERSRIEYLIPEGSVVLLQFAVQLLDVVLQTNDRLVFLIQLDPQLDQQSLLMLQLLVPRGLLLAVGVQLLPERVELLAITLFPVGGR